jgi:hypothetical protein
MLKAVVIGLGMLIVIALGAVVVGIVQKFSHKAPAPAAGVGQAFALPAGAKIVEMQTSGNRLVLRLHPAEGGDEIDIVDTSDGHLIARIK